MKIVFLSAFTFSNNIGGIESHIYFMAKALQKRGHEITIVQPIDSPDTEIKCQVEDNITIQFIPTKTPGLIRFLNQYNGVKLVGFVTAFLNKAKYFLYRKKIAQVVKRIAPDIVHQHDFISNIFTTKLLAKEFSCILTNHTGEYLFFQKSLIGRFLLKYLLRHYKYIIGPSTELTPFKYNKNSVTIHNGVDLSLFNVNNDRLELRLKYGIQPNRFVVLCPRRWAPTKGILYLMQAIRDGGFDSKFMFLFAGSDYDGYPRYKQRVLNIMREIPNQDLIYLLGNLSFFELANYYRLADVVVIPSLMEAVSLAALEAMACGTPVISTNVGGMPELIVNEFNGLLVEPRNPIALANAIWRLYKDKELYHKLELNSLKTAERYSWDIIAEKTEHIYINAITITKQQKIVK